MREEELLFTAAGIIEEEELEEKIQMLSQTLSAYEHIPQLILELVLEIFK